jgi:hypothetical protein
MFSVRKMSRSTRRDLLILKMIKKLPICLKASKRLLCLNCSGIMTTRTIIREMTAAVDIITGVMRLTCNIRCILTSSIQMQIMHVEG